MKKELVTVVIPIYLEEPSELEKISLQQTLKILHKYPITFMTRDDLNTAWYEEYCRGKATIRFERFTWRGFDEFSVLLTSAKFYQRFLGYEYMLTCHMDAFVFRDEVEKWCQLGYDYIGSVIYNHAWDKTYSKLQWLLRADPPEYYGNGGFSLKKIEGFYRLTSRFRLFLNAYHWVRKNRKRHLLDDIFIAQIFPSLSSNYRVAPKALAQKFGAAWEFWDEKDLPFTNQDCTSLPFGIHGWFKYHPEFWKPCIRECGYEV